MAYSTGIAGNLSALYDALLTFATSNGWSLIDTITTRDKVIRSQGTDSRRSMYVRLTGSAEAGTPFKSVTSLHKGVPHILTRGYQNWTPSTGLNEFGYVGPFIAAGQQAISTGRFYFHPFEATPFPTSYGAIQAKGLSTNLAGAQPWGRHSEERSFMQAGGTTFTLYDVPTGEAITSAVGTGLTSGFNNAVCVVHDANNQTWAYGLSSTATLADQLWRWNVDTGELAKMPAPPWAAVSCNGGWLVWDGNDTIYGNQGGGSTAFAKFTISTQTWTSLTVQPVARAAGAWASTGNNQPWSCVYMPAAVTGLAEDTIAVLISAASTSIHRYNVTANTWTTFTTSAPVTVGGQTYLFWDYRKYLYIAAPNAATTSFYRASIDGPGLGTFVQLGTLEESLRWFEGMDLLNPLACKLRASNSLAMTYWFIGDADSVTAVVKISGRYYWMHFGRFTSTYRPDVMKTTGAATAGAQVTVAVDISTNYSAGDEVLIFDPATNKAERQVIQSVPGGTSVVLNLTNSYGTGSLIGVDPDNQVVTGDTGWAVCLLDARGYRTDPMSATYALQPQFDNKEEMARYNLSGRGYTLPQPMKIASFYSGLPNTYETRGVLRGVYALTNGVYPRPQAEEIVRVDGKQYLVFNPAYTARLVTNNPLIVVGPIN